MQFHTESMGLTQGQLEQARVAATEQTPLAKVHISSAVHQQGGQGGVQGGAVHQQGLS